MAFAHIRLPYDDTLQYFLHKETLVHELPVILEHPDCELLQTLAYQHVEAVLSPPLHDMLQDIIHAQSVPQFYTDGSLMFPCNPAIRFAAYAVVWDLCQDDGQREQGVRDWKLLNRMPDTLKTLSAARVQGNQTICSAELSAVVKVCEWFPRAILHIDAQSVLDIIQRCQVVDDLRLLVSCEEYDLVQRLWRALRRGTFEFHKVKAHEDATLQPSLLLAYRTLGNQKANDAAIQACKYMYPAEANALHSMAKDVENDMNQLQRLYKMHLELHQARIRQEQLDQQQDMHGQETADPVDQLVQLQQWRVESPRDIPPIRVDWSLHTVLGPTLSAIFARWGRQLVWPDEQTVIPDDPGVTFMELAVSFCLYAGTYLPAKRIKSDGLLYLTIPQSSAHAAALEIKLCEIGIMMSYLMHQVNQLCVPPIFPDYKHAGCKSLYRLGAKTIEGHSQETTFSGTGALYDSAC
eukprot:Skav215996  [mRNA]  locus=scaffold4693:170068:171459:- [translate_table: standard]